MAEADNNSLLRQLLDSAKPFEPGRADTVANRQPASERPLDGDVESTVSAIQFLVNGSHLDLATYSEWINLGIALKHTHAESGFTIWHQFSASAGGYEGEDECRVNWDNIKSHSAGRPLTMATYFAKAKELGWKFPHTAGRPKTDDDGDGGPVKGEDYAAYTVRLIEEAGQEVWLDQEDRPHVTYVADLPDGGSVKRHLPIEGSGYRAVLEMLFFQAAGNKVLKKEQADNAASLLAMKARTAGIRHASALRIGMHEGAIYVDLGTLDGAAVEIDPTGWRIVSQPPVRFIRGSRGTLPTPEMGGTFEDFKAHFNADDADLLRAIGFMIGTFNPAGPYPLLMVDGGPGSAKSSFTDKVLSLTDPPHQFKSGRMSFNSKEQDLHIAAQGVHVMCFDNISYFSAEAADMLCRVATGGGSGSRKLYSNDQYQQFVVVRPVVLSCIGVPSSRSDLLDRSLIIKAQPIQRRRTERRMQAEFNTARPKLFGFLLSCVSAALRNQANIDAAVDDDRLVLPRMADFATFVEGAAEQLNLAIGGFSALLREGQGALQMEAVSGNVVGAALLAYFSRVDAQPLTGSATNVLDTLRATNGNDHRWPASNKLAATLQRLSIGLHVLGIEWHMTEASGHDNVAKYRIWPTSSFKAQVSGPKHTNDDPGNDGAGHF